MHVHTRCSHTPPMHMHPHAQAPPMDMHPLCTLNARACTCVLWGHVGACLYAAASLYIPATAAVNPVLWSSGLWPWPHGPWLLAPVFWPLAPGAWPLALGPCPLALDAWRLHPGAWPWRLALAPGPGAWPWRLAPDLVFRGVNTSDGTRGWWTEHSDHQLFV
eukprot:CAMPEP_0174706662 /NCGR_PEP_ID=MMETSP1094-20130205/9426_1 /TAXON_ID=156173 /ORGANISM="Chrysochromulina brevifilum, Strain UTEX LB 985" /LENGTH=161 /DNA_ID=CAMNT_0015904953 /DNA_START=171 /DNA_END=656 /DNA_ORIENTATION=-